LPLIIPARLPSPLNVQPSAVGVTTTLPMPKARMAARVCATSSALITGPRQRSHSALSARFFSKRGLVQVEPLGLGQPYAQSVQFRPPLLQPLLDILTGLHVVQEPVDCLL
jgi:hypothetical protein